MSIFVAAKVLADTSRLCAVSKGLVFILLSSVAGGRSAAPHEADPRLLTRSAEHCKALQSANFATVLDAPIRIQKTNFVTPSGESPGYCQVEGYVTPRVGFVLRLPSDNWNGKLIQLGCGGSCGQVSGSLCSDAVNRGYACIVSDLGHQGGGLKWAYNNLAAEIDLAYRATHVTALAGKAIVESYFQAPPRKAYFSGCSGGGASRAHGGATLSVGL